MATSESQKRATARYQKANTKMRSVRFYPSERDILAWLVALLVGLGVKPDRKSVV